MSANDAYYTTLFYFFKPLREKSGENFLNFL